MRRLALFVLLTFPVIIKAQIKVNFQKSKYLFEEKADTTTENLYLTVTVSDSTLHRLTITDTHDGDAASVHDYSIKQPLVLIVSIQTPTSQSFPITICPDNKDEPDESVIIQCKYEVKKKDLSADSTITIADTVIIKNYQPPVKAPQVLYSKRFYWQDTSFLASVETGADYRLTICKIKENDVAHLTENKCESEPISDDITKSDFAAVLTKLTRRVCTADTVNHLRELHTIADSFYVNFTNKVKDKKSETAVQKEMEKYNKQITNRLDAIDSVLKQRRDTGYVDIHFNLQRIPLYHRRFLVPDTLVAEGLKSELISFRRGNSEKLYDTVRSYIYEIKNAADTISFDSLSIRIEDGYITSLVLYPDASGRTTYNLNRITVIRRYFDLRSSREAAENLDYYIPLESNYTYYRFKYTKFDSTHYVRKFKSHRLNANKTNESTGDQIFTNLFVNLSELIRYIPNIDSVGDVIVHVKNRNVSIGMSNNKPLHLFDKDFNSFAQLNIYSDLVGLTEDKPNGLLQAEGKFQAGLFTQPLFNNTYYSRFHFNVLPNASLTFAFTKIDNKLRYLPIARDSVQFYDDKLKKHSETSTDTVYKHANTIDLLQYASLEVSARATLARFESDFATFLVYGGLGVVRTPVNDTLSGKDPNGNSILNENKTVVNSLKTFYGLKIKLKSTSNLGVELGLEWIRLRLNSSIITQTYNFYDSDRKKNVLRQTKPGVVRAQNVVPKANIYYYLDKDQQKRFFIRSQYIIAANTKTDDYFTFQVGYSTDLKGVFKLFHKDND